MPLVHAAGNEEPSILKIRGKLASILIARGRQASEAIGVAEALTQVSSVEVKQLANRPTRKKIKSTMEFLKDVKSKVLKSQDRFKLQLQPNSRNSSDPNLNSERFNNHVFLSMMWHSMVQHSPLLVATLHLSEINGPS